MHRQRQYRAAAVLHVIFPMRIGTVSDKILDPSDRVPRVSPDPLKAATYPEEEIQFANVDKRNTRRVVGSKLRPDHGMVRF